MPPAEKPPTHDDVTAIGNAASTAATETAESGGTPEAAGNAAAEAARTEATARGIELPDHVIKAIAQASAAATVAELANQGAIGSTPPGEHDDDDDDQADDQADAGAGAPGEPPAGDPPPTKQTLAQKLLSGYHK